MSQKVRVVWLGFAVAAMALTGIRAWADAATPPASPPPPYLKGSAQNGATKAATCLACHGQNGNSTNPEWPVLAGQNAVYIAEQLQLFRANVRVNAVMMPMVAPLSDTDFNDLAMYFEAQTPTGGEADPSYWKEGEALYRRGDKSHDVPACIACHGPIGRGNLASGYPQLRAQHSVYTIKQLTDYANGSRYAPAAPGKPSSRNGYIMATIAKRLTPEQIRDVASYVQGLR